MESLWLVAICGELQGCIKMSGCKFRPVPDACLMQHFHTLRDALSLPFVAIELYFLDGDSLWSPHHVHHHYHSQVLHHPGIRGHIWECPVTTAVGGRVPCVLRTEYRRILWQGIQVVQALNRASSTGVCI